LLTTNSYPLVRDKLPRTKTQDEQPALPLTYTTMSSTPELLYHTTLTVADYHADRSDNAKTVYVLGTHATLVAAKQFAANALHTLGYEPEDFAVFEGHQPEGHWRRGDGVAVYAQAFNGRELLVGILTTPNPGFAARDNGTLDLPHAAAGHLHYMLQSTTDYNRDRSGAAQTTEIEGCFLRRDDAARAAKECLIQAVGPRDEFAQYDERADVGPAEDVSFPGLLPLESTQVPAHTRGARSGRLARTSWSTPWPRRARTTRSQCGRRPTRTRHTASTHRSTTKPTRPRQEPRWPRRAFGSIKSSGTT